MDDRIIKNIKEAVDQSQATKRAYDVSTARLIEKDMSVSEKVSLFESRGQFSGSKVYVVEDASKLKSTLAGIIPSGSSVMAAVQGEIGSIKDMIPAGCEFVEDKDLTTDKLFNVDVAITDVKLAVAETGSILVCNDKTGPRMKSLVCSKHIALIRADQICSDLMDVSEYLSALGCDKLPGGFNLISGPSKTADIELQLVIGVHGPAELHLVVIKGK